MQTLHRFTSVGTTMDSNVKARFIVISITKVSEAWVR
jgi:hypothetical protein